MSYATMVLLAGIVATAALLLAQWRLVAARPEHFRAERVRGALYLAILFVSIAATHWYLTQAERQEEKCCLRVFDLPEEPPPGTGPQQIPPPAPPRPPG